MKTGERFDDSEPSTVDTALLLAGALFCQSYFDGAHPEEVEIRQLVDQIYRRVDWTWAQPHAPAISLGWSPEESFLEYDWRGYNEAKLVYVLALASPTHPVGADARRRVDSVRAGTRDPGRRQHVSAVWPLHLRHLWLSRCVHPELHLHRR